MNCEDEVKIIRKYERIKQKLNALGFIIVETNSPAWDKGFNVESVGNIKIIRKHFNSLDELSGYVEACGSSNHFTTAMRKGWARLRKNGKEE